MDGRICRKFGCRYFPGFTAKEIIYDENEKVDWSFSGEKGVTKNGEKSNLYEPKIALKANQTFFAEGCRGHLGKKINKKSLVYMKKINFKHML